jgi:hypothetical protein
MKNNTLIRNILNEKLPLNKRFQHMVEGLVKFILTLPDEYYQEINRRIAEFIKIENEKNEAAFGDISPMKIAHNFRLTRHPASVVEWLRDELSRGNTVENIQNEAFYILGLAHDVKLPCATCSMYGDEHGIFCPHNTKYNPNVYNEQMRQVFGIAFPVDTEEYFRYAEMWIKHRNLEDKHYGSNEESIVNS